MSRIGLLIIATGKYDRFVPPLHESVQKYFMLKHDVTVFVFTDKPLSAKNGLVVIQQDHEPWPNPTLKRYHVFDKYKEVLSEMDYLYYCDADMLFVSKVGDEILPNNSSDLVATEHPGFHGGRRGTYETRYESTAYVSPLDGDCYYAGGFNGGTSAAFLKMAEVIRGRVDEDLKHDIIAIWHDESHLNRYMIDVGPKALSPSYCYPESLDIPFEKKLLALDKNHEEMRSQE